MYVYHHLVILRALLITFLFATFEISYLFHYSYEPRTSLTLNILKQVNKLHFQLDRRTVDRNEL